MFAGFSRRQKDPTLRNDCKYDDVLPHSLRGVPLCRMGEPPKNKKAGGNPSGLFDK